MKKIKRHKAFTLIELMVTSFATGMLILVIMTAMGNVLDTKKDINDNFNARYNILGISNTFQEEINKATVVYFSADRIVIGMNSSTYGIASGEMIVSEYEIKDDYILYNGIPLVPIEKGSAQFVRRYISEDQSIELEFKVRNVQNYESVVTQEEPVTISARLQFGQVKSITDYVEVTDDI